MRAKRTREEWAALIRQVEATGEPMKAFCAKRRIRLKTFEWWRWQLRRAAARKKTQSSRKRAALAVRLIPVEMPAPATRLPTHVEMSVRDVQLRIEVGTSVSYVGELVVELRSRC
jgi:hypothetical protein